MKHLIFNFFFVLFSSSNVFGINFENYTVNQFTEVTRAVESLGPPQRLCPLVQGFKSNDDLIESICFDSQDLSYSELKELLKRRGAKEILERQEISFDDFLDSFNFFNRINSKLERLVEDSVEGKWEFKSPSDDDFSFWQNKLKESEGIMPIINLETKNGEIPFLAANHLYRLDKDMHSKAKSEIREHFDLVKPNAIVVEGFEIGKALPCQYVLSKVLQPDELISSEIDYSMKIAFNRKIAIIPGDSQSIDEIDNKIQSQYSMEELKKLKEDFKILDFLHGYYTNLINNSDDPIGATITQLNGQGIEVSADEMNSIYKELNGRSLPDNAQEIYQDFTPPKHSSNPKGTNWLVSKQDDLRNQGLVSAAQIGLENFGKTMVVFGSGHLPEVASSIEKY